GPDVFRGRVIPASCRLARCYTRQVFEQTKTIPICNENPTTDCARGLSRGGLVVWKRRARIAPSAEQTVQVGCRHQFHRASAHRARREPLLSRKGERAG